MVTRICAEIVPSREAKGDPMNAVGPLVEAVKAAGNRFSRVVDTGAGS